MGATEIQSGGLQEIEPAEGTHTKLAGTSNHPSSSEKQGRVFRNEVPEK
jgi:hypothetical protein